MVFMEGDSGLPREVVYNVKSVGAKNGLYWGVVSQERGLSRRGPLYVHVCGWVGEDGKDYSVFVIKTV